MSSYKEKLTESLSKGVNPLLYYIKNRDYRETTPLPKSILSIDDKNEIYKYIPYLSY